MKLPVNPISILAALIIGIIVGFIGGPVYALIPWAIIGVIIGWVSSGKKSAVLHGAVYGFALAFVFMIHGYNGTDPLVTKLLPFAALGVVGAVFGLFWGFIGSLLPHKKQPERSHNS